FHLMSFSPISSLNLHHIIVFICLFSIDPATTKFHTLSLHDALPISARPGGRRCRRRSIRPGARSRPRPPSGTPRCRRRSWAGARSEEHTSELQSRGHLVCRLLLEKKIEKSVYAVQEVVDEELLFKNF